MGCMLSGCGGHEADSRPDSCVSSEIFLAGKDIVDNADSGILMTTEEVEDMGGSEEDVASVQSAWDALDDGERQAQECARSLAGLD